MSHNCEPYAETGRCEHGPRVRLHLIDAGRAGEIMADYCELLDQLGAPGHRVTGYQMCCDACCTIRLEAYPSFSEARTAAQESGWVTVGADDFCPDCITRGDRVYGEIFEGMTIGQIMDEMEGR